jgi:hypothetical protein
MKKAMFLVASATITITIFLAACSGGVQTSSSEPISHDSLIRRGDYLVTTMGCDDCHTSKKVGPTGVELDLEHRLGGHLSANPLGKADPGVMKNGWVLFSMSQTALMGPWGISYSANISSDATGIGNWTEEQFTTALRKGKSKGLAEGRDLLPPMPWQGYAKLSDADIKAIFAYLKSTKPVNNLVPAPMPLQDIK